MPRIVVLLSVVAALLLGSVPAQAIIGGEEDGQLHPNVGGVIVRFDDVDPGQIVLICSGSLVTPTIFLTAAHCNPALFPPEWETTLLGVSFDPAFNPTTSTIIPAAEEGFVSHPDYVDADWPYTPDIGVIHLAEPVTGIEPVELPEAGLIDEIRSQPAFRRQLLTQVGYGQVGVTHGGGRPQEIYPDIRNYASAWLRLEHGREKGLDPNYIFKTAHPGGPDGTGGTTCYGDSGGPLFLGDATSNLQIGVHSGGRGVGFNQNLCRAWGFAFRLDTAIAREFLCAQGVSAACEPAGQSSPDQNGTTDTKEKKDRGGKKATKGKHSKHKARR